jgi:hypothetical protein
MKASKENSKTFFNLETIMIMNIFEFLEISKNLIKIKNKRLNLFHLQYLNRTKIKHNFHIDLSCFIEKMSLDTVNALQKFNITSVSVKLNDLKKEELQYLLLFLHSKMILSLNLEISSLQLSEELINQLYLILKGLHNLKYFNLDISNSNVNDINLWTIFISLKNLPLISLCLDLHNNILSDNAFIISSLSLKKLINLTHLTINFESCEVTPSGISVLSTAISKLRKINKLSINLNCNSLKDTDITSLMEALQKLSSLTSLEIKLYETQITNLEPFAKYLRMLNSKLTFLNINLSNNILSCEIEKLFQLTDFPEINYRKNLIGKIGASHLGLGIMNMVNLTTLKLYLHNTNIEKEGIESISKSFDKIKLLTSLSLMLEMNFIEDEGLNNLAKGLSKLNRLQLLELELAHNNITNIQGFSSGLNNLKNLTFLSFVFDQNNISETKNFLSLSNAISNLTMLKSITLSFSCNEILDYNPLSKTLIKLAFLDKLCLSFSHNPISKTCFKSLNYALGKMTKLKSLSLNFNKTNLEDDEFIDLVRSVNKLINLNDLIIDINKNSISDKGAKVLLGSFVYLNLNSLFINLRDNRITEKMLEILVDKYGLKIDLQYNI